MQTFYHKYEMKGKRERSCRERQFPEMMRGFFSLYLAVPFSLCPSPWQYNLKKHLSEAKRTRTWTEMLKTVFILGPLLPLVSAVSPIPYPHYGTNLLHIAGFLQLEAKAPWGVMGLFPLGSTRLIWILVPPQTLCLSPTSDPVCPAAGRASDSTAGRLCYINEWLM